MFVTKHTTANKKAQSLTLYDGENDFLSNDPVPSDVPHAEEVRATMEKRENNVFFPSPGRYTIPFNGTSLVFDLGKHTTRAKVAVDSSHLEITISCSSRRGGLDPIHAFLKHIEKQANVKDPSKTYIYRAKQWAKKFDSGIAKPKRSLDSVSLEHDKKARLLNDIRTYLAPEMENWYAKRGIPLRRGYLSYGPPGTGKTSLACAIASEFNLSIYVISLTECIDNTLAELFDNLPKYCVVLLEDIDSAGIKRQNMRDDQPPAKNDNNSKNKQMPRVTLSGLLNVIDGPCSKDGRILIMSSNTPDSLDPALIRPGRIDQKVHFGNASHEISKSLFMNIMLKTADEVVKGDQATEFSVKRMDELASSFASKIPPNKLSPAEVQNFLLSHRDQPLAAVAEIEKAAADILAAKEKGSNVIEESKPDLHAATAKLEAEAAAIYPTESLGSKGLEDNMVGEIDNGDDIDMQDADIRAALEKGSSPAEIFAAMQRGSHVIDEGENDDDLDMENDAFSDDSGSDCSSLDRETYATGVHHLKRSYGDVSPSEDEKPKAKRHCSDVSPTDGEDPKALTERLSKLDSQPSATHTPDVSCPASDIPPLDADTQKALIQRVERLTAVLEKQQTMRERRKAKLRQRARDLPAARHLLRLGPVSEKNTSKESHESKGLNCFREADSSRNINAPLDKQTCLDDQKQMAKRRCSALN